MIALCLFVQKPFDQFWTNEYWIYTSVLTASCNLNLYKQDFGSSEFSLKYFLVSFLHNAHTYISEQENWLSYIQKHWFMKKFWVMVVFYIIQHSTRFPNYIFCIFPFSPFKNQFFKVSVSGKWLTTAKTGEFGHVCSNTYCFKKKFWVVVVFFTIQYLENVSTNSSHAISRSMNILAESNIEQKMHCSIYGLLSALRICLFFF